jgi:trimeric autotransporter adhesin
MRNYLLPVSLSVSLLQRAIGKMLVVSALAAGVPLFAQITVISADNLTPFQPRDVGTMSEAKTVRIKLNYARAISSIAVAPGVTEFTAGVVSGCVVDGHTINPALSACSVDVTFSPQYPGVRTAPLVVTDSMGKKSSVGLAGIGLAARTALTPGIVTTIAGNGTKGFSGDGGPATAAQMNEPYEAKFDAAGNLYINDSLNGRLRKVDRNGIITTVAGGGNGGCFSGAGGPATSASLGEVFGLALDPAGNIYIATTSCGVVKVDLNGILTVFYGDFAYGMATDAAGNVYIAASGRIVKVDTRGSTSTVAGGGPNYPGDGGPATQAELLLPNGVAVDAAGNLYIADWSDSRVRKVDTNGIITTVAGNGSPGFSGDGGQATQAELFQPDKVSVDAAGNIYISDSGNSRIRRVDTNGLIKTVAGGGNLLGNVGDGRPATQSEMSTGGTAIDPSGMLYVADTYQYRIRKIDVSQSAVNFASQNVGTVSPSQQITVTNIGNQHIELTGLSLSDDFGQQTGLASDCTDTTVLGAGFSCALRITFAPTAAGSLTGSAVVTGNSLSLPGTTQAISLSGTGTNP